jgi:hypothetical protein
MSAGAQWRADVKAELAKRAKARRQRRGKIRPDASSRIAGPGMVRIEPRRDQDGA